MLPILPLLLTLAGCTLIDGHEARRRLDPDGDHVPWDEDCDSDDATIGAATNWYYDADGDGYGDPYDALTACEAPSGYIGQGGDCDDDDPDFNLAPTWYRDLDGDGHGDPDETTEACTCPSGYVEGAEDCDDTDASVHPGVDDYYDGIDDDCDGNPDEIMDGEIDLSLADAKLTGVNMTGNSVSAGVGEILVGSYADPTYGTYTGAAYLAQGPFSGRTSLATGAFRLVGERAGDMAGWAVALADIDGDGYTDAVIGARQESTGGDDAGAVYLVLAPITADTSLSEADAKLLGESSGNWASYSLASGDLDGDEAEDLLIGAICESTNGSNAGAVYVLLGGATGTQSLSHADAKLLGEDYGDQVGDSTAIDDMDGDGIGDALTGSYNGGPSSTGSVYVVFGPVSGQVDLSAADARLLGEANGDHAGTHLATGDINGDGRPDLVIGAPGEGSGGAEAGAGYLVLGPVAGDIPLSSADAKMVGEVAGDEVSATASGDVNADGRHDILLGASFSSAGGGRSGATYLVLGPVTGTLDLSRSDARLVGATSSDAAGLCLDSADVDGDSIDDVLVGAYGADSVYLLLGWSP